MNETSNANVMPNVVDSSEVVQLDCAVVRTGVEQDAAPSPNAPNATTPTAARACLMLAIPARAGRHPVRLLAAGMHHRQGVPAPADIAWHCQDGRVERLAIDEGHPDHQEVFDEVWRHGLLVTEYPSEQTVAAAAILQGQEKSGAARGADEFMHGPLQQPFLENLEDLEKPSKAGGIEPELTELTGLTAASGGAVCAWLLAPGHDSEPVWLHESLDTASDRLDDVGVKP